MDWLLQDYTGYSFLYLDMMRNMKQCIEIRSLPPSWVSSCWKKLKVDKHISSKKDSTKLVKHLD